MQESTCRGMSVFCLHLVFEPMLGFWERKGRVECVFISKHDAQAIIDTALSAEAQKMNKKRESA